MISVICSLLVFVNAKLDKNASVPWEVRASVEGKVISSNGKFLLVDFSEDAKKQNFVGDYSKVIVDRDECVRR